MKLGGKYLMGGGAEKKRQLVGRVPNCFFKERPGREDRKGLEDRKGHSRAPIDPESQEKTLAFNYYFLRLVLPHLEWLEQGNGNQGV